MQLGLRSPGRGSRPSTADSSMETSTRRSLIPMSPSHTPRSYDKIPRDNRSVDGNGNGNGNGKHDKEKGVNIQVVLRCR